MPPTSRRPNGRRPVTHATVFDNINWREVIDGDSRYAEFIKILEDVSGELADVSDGTDPNTTAKGLDNLRVTVAFKLMLQELVGAVGGAFDQMASDAATRDYTGDGVAAIQHCGDVAIGASGDILTGLAMFRDAEASVLGTRVAKPVEAIE